MRNRKNKNENKKLSASTRCIQYAQAFKQRSNQFILYRIFMYIFISVKYTVKKYTESIQCKNSKNKEKNKQTEKE